MGMRNYEGNLQKKKLKHIYFQKLMCKKKKEKKKWNPKWRLIFQKWKMIFKDNPKYKG